MDYPHLRVDPLCPLCPGPKSHGCFVCWPCFRRHDMRNSTPAHITQHLDMRERFLAHQDAINQQLAKVKGF